MSKITIFYFGNSRKKIEIFEEMKPKTNFWQNTYGFSIAQIDIGTWGYRNEKVMLKLTNVKVTLPKSWIKHFILNSDSIKWYMVLVFWVAKK